MSTLDFLLVAGLTAVVVFVVFGLVLWLTARARKRRDAAEASGCCDRAGAYARRVIRTLLLLTSVALALVSAANAAAPVVPVRTQAQIAKARPALAYAPTRMLIGFHFRSWRGGPAALYERFANKAGWEITFVSAEAGRRASPPLVPSFLLIGVPLSAGDCKSRPRGRLEGS